MIKVQHMVPEVYYNKSRDFQYLGRIFDVIIGALKTNSDIIRNLPLSKNSDKELLDLAALTLGLKLSHPYNVEQLYAICTIFSTALKNKGNITSIQLVTDALLKLQNAEMSSIPAYDNINNILNLYLPLNLQDNQLLNDILDYILPAGIRCDIYTYVEASAEATSLFKQNDSINAIKKLSKDTSYIPKYGEADMDNYDGGGRDENSVVVPYTDPNN